MQTGDTCPAVWARLRRHRLLLSLVGGWVLLPLAAFGGPSDQRSGLPDSDKTPGAVNKVLTEDVICHKGWSTKSVRNVPAAEKRKVYETYGMDKTKPPCPCEVDHLISLEIGGSNDIKNLWPQSYQGTWNAHVKDKLENRLHKEVCDGTTALQDAQQEISTDWIKAYKARFK